MLDRRASWVWLSLFAVTPFYRCSALRFSGRTPWTRDPKITCPRLPVLRRHSRVSPQPSVTRSRCPSARCGQPFRAHRCEATSRWPTLSGPHLAKRRTAACTAFVRCRRTDDDRPDHKGQGPRCSAHPFRWGATSEEAAPAAERKAEVAVRFRRTAPDRPEQMPPTEAGETSQPSPLGPRWQAIVTDREGPRRRACQRQHDSR